MNILVLYQDIQSGAKIATESIVSAYRKLYPDDQLRVYKQIARPFTGRLSFVRNMIWSMWDFRLVLRQVTNVDVIVFSLYTFAIPWKLIWGGAIPAIYHIHGDQRFLTKPARKDSVSLWYHHLVGFIVAFLQRYAVTSATRLAFVSTHARGEFLKNLHLVQLETKSFILPNGVDTAIFKPRPSHRKDPAYPIRLGYIGRLDEKKGIARLLASLHFLAQPTELTIAYPTPTDKYESKYLSNLRSTSRSVSTKHNIRFIQNPKPITDIYAHIDFLVLPSQQEMQPLVILEALASGVLPITTRVGGAKEILSQLSPLLLLEATSPTIIAKNILAIARNSSKDLSALRDKGRSIAKQYAWRNAAVSLRREILAILQRRYSR